MKRTPLARKTTLKARTALARGTSQMRRVPLAKRGKRKRSDIPNRDAAWRAAVRSIGQCVLCNTFGKVEAAHMNEDKGMALKVPDCFTAALCKRCHFEIDNGTELTREGRRQLMRSAVRQTIKRLFTTGVIGVL